MAFEDLVGAPRRIAKFVSLVIAVLMLAAVVACIVYLRVWLAVAAAVVSSWALLVFTELLKEELREIVASNGQRDTDERHARTASRERE